MAQWRTDSYEFKQPHNVHLYEMMMLADIYGNPINGSNPTGMAVDAFGRARVSQPYTLFDSFNRFGADSNMLVANSATGATVSHNANQASVDCQVGTVSGNYIYRESSKVFAYQPGKSLQILETFVMAPAQTGLRQRVGYFDTQNGIFLEQDGTTINFVKRSYTTGSLVETKISKTNWNKDKLDGAGPSRKTLDLTKAQILFIDVEWLGVGNVRCGFVIDGVFIHCHTFEHANIIDSTYMTTACLPVRYEIENTATTASSSTLKCICATVISEGGYEVRGKSRAAGHAVTTPYSMTTTGTLYPLFSMRLKSNRLNAIVDPKTFSVAVGAASNYRFAIVSRGVTSGGSWVDAGSNSAVEYNLTATSLSSGDVVDYSYIIASNQTSTAPQNAPTPFKYQLERNSFTNTPYEFVIVIVSSGNNNTAWGAVHWEEFT